jgi:hypothetical protein
MHVRRHVPRAARGRGSAVVVRRERGDLGDPGGTCNDLDLVHTRRARAGEVTGDDVWARYLVGGWSPAM